MLWVSTFKRTLKAYRIDNDLGLTFLSRLTVGMPVTQLLHFGNYLVHFDGHRMNLVDYTAPGTPTTLARNLALPVNAACFRGDTLITVGNGGVAAYRIANTFPSLLQAGGRQGTLLAVRDSIIAASDGSSVHLYSLGEGTATDVDDDPLLIPGGFHLAQNYPNPFNPSTTIEYRLPAPAHVSLVVFNILGRRVRVLVDAPRASGPHTVRWDGRDDTGRAVASGVYFYRLSADGMSRTRKMMLIK
jgi:hypothetical protein